MKKWIFCAKTTYLKILKAKDQLQLGSQAMIHHLAILSLTDVFLKDIGYNFSRRIVRKRWLAKKNQPSHNPTPTPPPPKNGIFRG